jgi:acylphosphatase
MSDPAPKPAPSPDREQVRAVVVVMGKVQGVFFRASTQEEAMRLGLYGEVSNLPDGSVEVIAEGERHAVETLVAWCRRGGPPMARVDDLDVRWSAPRGEFQTFRITRL